MIRLLLPGLLVGCDTAPSRIEVDVPAAAILDSSPFDLGTRFVTEGGEVVPGVASSYSVVPQDVLDVSPEGTASCRSTGDVSVVIAGGGLSSTVNVKCRLVATVEAPKGLTAILGNQPRVLDVQVLDAAGKELSDVAPRFDSSSPSVAQVRQGRVEPHSVGRTIIRSTAGPAWAETEVEVIQKVETDTLSLGDGELVTYTLPGQGRYRVEVHVKASDGSGHGVKLVWIGAPCQPTREARDLVADCEIPNTGSFTVKNPTMFGMGPAATGNVTIYRIP